MLAAQLLETVRQFLVANPPDGLESDFIVEFFANNTPTLVSIFELALSEQAPPTDERLDAENRGKWAGHNEKTIETWADNTAYHAWLFSRLLAHRPDLATAVQRLCETKGLSWETVRAESRLVYRPVPAVVDGVLVVYEADQNLEAELPGVITRTAFGEFAKAAYWSDDLSPELLSELAGSWFAQQFSLPSEPMDLSAHGDRLEELVTQTRLEGVLGDEVAERRLAVRLALLQAAGVVPDARRVSLPKPDPNLALSADELAEAMQSVPTGPGERQTANLAAVATLLAEPTIGDAKTLLKYTGWGGLTIEGVRSLLPANLAPDEKALIHEYYTPPNVALELSRVLSPLRGGLPRGPSGEILAIEPSAGVGRLVNAFSVPGWEAVNWTVIEYSALSASILRRARPDITVIQGSFEQWILSAGGRLDGRLGLVLCNPPFGQRGAEAAIDPDPAYRERKAYFYFLRRCLGLLAEGGIGVFVIPYGFLSSPAPQFVRLREQVLKAHHLIAAFRLPSSIYPGAGIVTDAILLESRGGRLQEVLADDRYIVEGNYFAENPGHLLGVERGARGEEEEAFRYEVLGDFTGLPDTPKLRERCRTCVLERRASEVPRAVQLEREREAALPEIVAHAAGIGRRVSRYLDLTSVGGLASQAQARAVRQELKDDLLVWAASHSLSSLDEYQDVSGIPSLVAAFQADGSVVPSIAEASAISQRYVGSESVADTARWYYRERGPFTENALREFRSKLGFNTGGGVVADLLAADFALDWNNPPVWMPQSDYYTGLVGERYNRALQSSSDPIAAAQLGRLRALIRFPTLQEIAPSPRLSWIELPLLREWIAAVLDQSIPELERVETMISFKKVPFANLKQQIGTKNDKAVLFGWLNYDMDLFQPPYEVSVSDDGEEESTEQALERARVQYGALKTAHFRSWLLEAPERVDAIEKRYTLGAFVPPTFDESPLLIGRWGNQVTLKPHQNSVVRRLVHYNGGLNAFDTGVGKTFSGIATMAMQRQLGVCRRPLVVVPNTLIWKWYRDILRCLPDYRVLVVGNKRRLNRSGVWISEPDTAQERNQKWRRFQSGQFDCAIVPYSFFGDIGLRRAAWEEFLLGTPLLARKLQLDARDLEEAVQRALERERTGKDPPLPSVGDKRAADFVGEEVWENASPEAREALRSIVQKTILEQNIERDKKLLGLTNKLGSLSERNRALFNEALDNWSAKLAQDTSGNEVTFEEIGVDMLLVDEAQNFKNIWPVGQLDGGTPKYLGAIQAGSARGVQLAAYRANLSRRLDTPGGTYLLSATPAKNSPIEYFTLIGLVNERAWVNVGVPTVESFIDRYLYIERRDVIQPDMSVKEQSVVSGFQNLIELRDVIFRYSEFKTASDVGLKLPDSKSETILVDMSPYQAQVYYKLADRYKDTIKALGHADGSKANRLKNMALSLLTRMQLATVHPQLATGIETKEHVAFEQLPYSHPDTPPEERDRRLMLLSLAKVPATRPDAIDEAYRMLIVSGDEDVLYKWRVNSAMLFEAAKRRYANKKKLKTQFSYASAVKAPDYHAPKLDKCVELILQSPRCGQIVFCDNVAVHRWLVELLVENGIDRNRIAVINGEVAKDAMRRLEISDKFNGVPEVVAPDGTIEVEAIAPAFDIVIANQAAYEGIDLHRRTCLVYHLDLPWEPSTLRQRNGRAVRQGNLESNVTIRFLMARRSLDVVRYEYILGKLRWMTDLISSSDNSLSNPAADSEIDSESLVLFMSQDEEEARLAIAQLKEAQERRRERAISSRAWRDFEALLQRRASLKAIEWQQAGGLLGPEYEERRTVLTNDIARLSASLASIPSWPYAWVLPLNRPVLIEHDSMQESIPIVEDWTLQLLVEFGRVGSSSFGWRRIGTIQWQDKSLADEDKDLAELLRLGYAAEDRGSSPRQADEDLAGQMAVLLDTLVQTGTFELLGLKMASATWRKRLWEKHWASIVAALKLSSLDFPVPLRLGDGTWRLVPSSDPQVSETTLAPFDREFYAEFYAYASTRPTPWSYTETALAAEQWWGVRFPRGRLRPDAISYDSQRLGRRLRAPVLESSAYLAVVEDKDGEPGERFLLIHQPSHSILRGFRSLDQAKLALTSVDSAADWWSERAPFEIPTGVVATLDRLAKG